MPPRFTYWTIIFGGQATAFRSGSRDELLPTFKQIQARHPDAQLRYFARGKLWYSEEEAQAALKRERFDKRERSRPSGPRPRPGEFRPRDEKRPPRGDFKPRDERRPPRPEGWRPRADFRKPEGGDRPPRRDDSRPRDDNRPPRPDTWKPRGENRPQKPGGWKPRGENRPPKPGGWRPRGDARKPEAGSGKPEAGGEHRGRGWRPGGAHEDPRARFKVPRDVKRARMAKKFGWKKKKDKE